MEPIDFEIELLDLLEVEFEFPIINITGEIDVIDGGGPGTVYSDEIDGGGP